MWYKLATLIVLLAQFLVIGAATSPASVASASPSTTLSAGVPFTDDFEAGALASDWSLQASSNGVVELNTDYVRSGNQSVFIGQRTSGSATASLILALDLTSQSDVFLDFWARMTGDFENRRVSISDNAGASWTEIRNFDGLSQSFSHEVIDLVYEATSKGLALNGSFRIAFSYSTDAGGDPGDGMAIDDVRLMQRAQAITSFPLAQESFEAISFPQGLYPQSFNSGVAEITSDYPRSGARSVFLGQRTSGNASSSLILALDLSGQTDVFLDFWTRSTGTFENRKVFISDNSGASWAEILNLDSLSQSFSHEVVNLAEVAASKGRSLNARFRIAFTYSTDAGGDPGDGFVIDDLRLVQKSQAIANFPLVLDGFESGTFAQGLYPQSSSSGIVEITTDFKQTGSRGVFIGQRVAGNAVASLVVALDLTGQSEVFLDFWVRSTGTFENRRILISDNSGSTWTEIRNLDSIPQTFRYEVIDIATSAKSKGLALNDRFRIAFTYSTDAGGDPGDGMAIDNFRLSASDPISSVYLPLLRR